MNQEKSQEKKREIYDKGMSINLRNIRVKRKKSVENRIWDLNRTGQLETVRTSTKDWRRLKLRSLE